VSATERGQDSVDDRTDGELAAVLTAARQVGLAIAPGDLAAVSAHLSLLLGFAAVVGDPVPEPAPVYRP